MFELVIHYNQKLQMKKINKQQINFTKSLKTLSAPFIIPKTKLNRNWKDCIKLDRKAGGK